jgi:hypothetical protein
MALLQWPLRARVLLGGLPVLAAVYGVGPEITESLQQWFATPAAGSSAASPSGSLQKP